MSVYTIIYVVVILAVFLGVAAFRKLMVKSATAQYPNAAAGLVAQRLGLQLVSGDPQLNVVMWEAQVPQFKDINPLPHTVYEVRLEAQGTPQGRPMRWLFYAKEEAGARLPVVRRTLTDTFHNSLEAKTQGTVPYFELILRSGQNECLQAEPVHASRTDMQRMAGAFQNPTYDAAFELTANDPRVAAVLSRVLGALAGLNWVHLVGAPGTLAFHFPRLGSHAFGTQAELYGQALLAIAGAFEAG